MLAFADIIYNRKLKRFPSESERPFHEGDIIGIDQDFRTMKHFCEKIWRKRVKVPVVLISVNSDFSAPAFQYAR